MAQITETEGVADLLDVLGHLDLPVTSSRQGVPVADGMADLLIHIDGEDQPLVVEVKRFPSPARIRQLVTRYRGNPAHHVLVADRLTSMDKEMLEQAGWGYLDRRGHIRLWLDRVRVDTRVDPLVEVSRRSPLDTGTGQAVAVCLLAAPGPLTVRGIAKETGVAVSSVSTALAGLRAEVLVRESSTEPVGPELFWALAGRWGVRERLVSLTEMPRPGDAGRTSQLGLGLDTIEKSPGWALRGDVAAAMWGAPLPLQGDAPPDFFVPDDRTLRIAKQLYGEAPANAGRAATVTVTPLRYVVTHRYDAAQLGLSKTEWPVVHPVIAALDLTRSGARGQEILEDFEPPEGFRRVW
ncbi:MAG: hypothetical protein M1134_05330 [Actinobacteria bacterium]|nr:hypothetical protein [Actinomycetota bacterium]